MRSDPKKQERRSPPEQQILRWWETRQCKAISCVLCSSLFQQLWRTVSQRQRPQNQLLRPPRRRQKTAQTRLPVHAASGVIILRLISTPANQPTNQLKEDMQLPNLSLLLLLLRCTTSERAYNTDRGRSGHQTRDFAF